MTRYLPSRHYFQAGLAALALAVFSAWCALGWYPAFAAAAAFLLSAALFLFLALRPPVEIHETHLAMGRKAVPWLDIRRVDRKGWGALLVVRMSLYNGKRVWLIYPGDLDSANSLLRHVRRLSRAALIEGLPYRQFWGEPSAAAPAVQIDTPRYRLLRPEDEAEVERLYQQLKASRHLDPRKSGEEE